MLNFYHCAGCKEFFESKELLIDKGTLHCPRCGGPVSPAHAHVDYRGAKAPDWETPEQQGKLFRIFSEISRECKRQDKKWGEQNHPMTRCVGSAELIESLKYFRMINEQSDRYDWYSILQEEIGEAFTETEPEKQREEMIQAATVMVRIIECLDRRMGEAKRVQEAEREKGD